jgi:hypothetical protein
MLWMQERGHRILSCPNFQTEPHHSDRTSQTGIASWSDRSISGLASQGKMETSFKGPIASRTRQGLLEARQRQEKKRMSKVKGRICYTYRLKGYLSQNCPKGNKYEPKVVNSTSNVHGKSNHLYDTRKVISSPSTRVIWVPKYLLTNLKGPNETWVLKLA